MSKRGNKFKLSIDKINDIKDYFEPGLKAFGSYSARIRLKDSGQGSVDLDKALLHKYPQANRWDYIFGYKDRAYFVEIHSANTREVKVMEKKLQWLKDWLELESQEPLRRIKAPIPYYWIQSGKFAIPKTSPQYRKIAQLGLIPKNILELD